MFVYPVSAVPKRKNWKNAPLATPTVLDAQPTPAFCPAPRDEPCGRVVDLSGADREPAREVLHAFRALDVADLFRVGEITGRVPDDLGPARENHLRRLREIRPDYALATNGGDAP